MFIFSLLVDDLMFQCLLSLENCAKSGDYGNRSVKRKARWLEEEDDELRQGYVLIIYNKLIESFSCIRGVCDKGR